MGVRTIEVAEGVELWPGRRLRTSDGLYALPRSAVRIERGKSESTLNFGTLSSTSLQLVGPTRRIIELFEAIIDNERPK